MLKAKVNHRRRPFADEAKTRAQKQNPTPPLLNSKKDKTYTKKQLAEIEALRRLRYNDLLNSARNCDMAACIVFPTADEFEIPLSRVCHSSAAKALPKGAHYIVKQKDAVLEQVLLRWLHDQRRKSVPVSGKLMKNAGHFACTVLCDLRDESDGTRSKVPLSFSAWWLDKFRKRYHISHCQLHGEAGGVDLQATEPELIEIRQLCAQYTLTISSTAMRLGYLDGDLDEPTLLLVDSAGSHNDINMRDPYDGVPWKHLRIQRLPVNSTSVTLPLDAGVISAFKRVFLEMLGFETYYARNFDQTTSITNGHAWSLVPYAWDQMKPFT
ncbi:hypothetical protein BGX30_005862, partial [Mortierella sp. GBA39]